MDLQWNTLANYPRYDISIDGKIFDKSLNKLLSFQSNKDGYLKVTLRNDDGRKTFSVHRLVALTFIENPHMKETVNHKDGDKKNNVISNLEWATRSEQTQHAWDSGLILDFEARKTGIRDKQGKRILCIETGEVFSSCGEAAEKYGLRKSNISSVCLGKKWCKSAGVSGGVKLTWRYIENE